MVRVSGGVRVVMVRLNKGYHTSRLNEGYDRVRSKNVVRYRKVEAQGLFSAHCHTAHARHGCARETSATGRKPQIGVVGFGLPGMGFCVNKGDALDALKV